MQAYRPDRVVRALGNLASIAYFGLLALGAFVLVAAPILKLAVWDDPDWTWGLQVPAAVHDSAAIVETRWGNARLEIEDVRGDLKLPIGMLPWGMFVLLWTHAAVALGLMGLALHHLRRVFQRVRDGAPFDERNALRLRWLGLVLLALALFNGVAEFITAMAVRRGLASDSITVPAELHFSAPLIFVGLVLVALAEIFRRGAELETEQALVV